MITELKKGIYWVGIVDWELKHFHGFELSTHRGSTYNAYLVVDEKTALIDTVWGPFSDEFIKNVRKVVDPSQIDMVVANHSEPDHSGSLPLLLEHCPKAKVIVSKRGLDSFPGHYHREWNFKEVKTGDRISLGNKELVFIEAQMLHWPDSMFTYLTGDSILFSNDAFGQHYATAFRFNDLVDQKELYEEALKYYANILNPFSPMVTRKIAEIQGLGLPLEMIAPSHGVIWRSEPAQIIEKYLEWAAQKPEKKAVILFDTMWQATRKMAEAVGEGLAGQGVPYKLFHMAKADRNDVITDIFKVKGVILGSPTLNGGILPTMSPLLEDMRGHKFKNKVGAAFGSYGWSGESVKILEEHLGKSRIPLAAEGVRAKWQPRPDDLEACRRLGAAVAEAVKSS